MKRRDVVTDLGTPARRRFRGETGIKKLKIVRPGFVAHRQEQCETQTSSWKRNWLWRQLLLFCARDRVLSQVETRIQIRYSGGL
jgi:hypothetical protein